MAIPVPNELTRKLRAIGTPTDYFSEPRAGGRLQPERILCFTRRSRIEAAAEPLARHHHHRHVLMIPWQGEGEVQADERRFALAPGRALLVFPFQFHHGIRFSRESVLWQYITFEMEESRAGSALEALRADPMRILPAEDLFLFERLVDAWNQRGAGDEELSHWLALILVRMNHAPLPPRSGPSGARVRPGKGGAILALVNHQCMTQLDQGFGVKELASLLSISESHLRSRFRNETGLSLGRHMRRLRLQKAMGLLLQTDQPVTRISERCGFDSVFSFSRSFRRFSGLSAREYRQRYSMGGGTRPHSILAEAR